MREEGDAQLGTEPAVVDRLAVKVVHPISIGGYRKKAPDLPCLPLVRNGWYG